MGAGLAATGRRLGLFTAALGLGGPGQATMIALAAYITGPLITAVALLGAAFIKLGLVILSTPIGWIVTVMAAAIYVLIKRWDDFVDYWANLWTRITDAFEEGWVQGIVAVFAEFNPLVHVARGINAIIEYFTGVSLIDEGSALIQSFWDGMKAVGLDVAGWLRGLFDQAIDYLASLPAEFFNMGANIITGLWDGLKSVGGSVTGWLSDTFSFGGGQGPAQGGQGDGKGWFNWGAPAAPEPPAVRPMRITPPDEVGRIIASAQEERRPLVAWVVRMHDHHPSGRRWLKGYLEPLRVD